MTTPDNRPWWAYTKAEQKQQIENAVDGYLSENAQLTNRQKMLLRDALGHTYRGLFGLAAQDMYELSLPESAWNLTARVEPSMVEGVSHEMLRRVLAGLRASSVQPPCVSVACMVDYGAPRTAAVLSFTGFLGRVPASLVLDAQERRASNATT
jgi:hypothetical protein